ncbi:glycosyltransferase [Flavobacterium sp. LAR06]|uniref:glycosyltransferase n=1 Tax=Flavobacterium sp. LAR06 TaxID=3064897 RepID=UPI0035C269AE
MKLSVILPIYNAQQYVSEAIQSILDQTYKDFELILINDGSTDNSIEIIKTFKDPRIVLIDQVNKGLAASLNHGLAVSKGKYIARMDADDIAYPTRFEVQMSYLVKNPEFKLVGSAVEVIDKEGKTLCIDAPYTGNAFLKKFMNKVGNPFKHPTVIFDRDVVLDLGGYNETIGKYFEDYFLWVKIAKYHKVEILNEVLLKYRITPGSIMSSIKNKEFSDFMLRSIHKDTFSKTDQEEMLAIKNREIVDKTSSIELYNKRIQFIKSNRMNRLFLFLKKNFNFNTAMNIAIIAKKVRVFKGMYIQSK